MVWVNFTKQEKSCCRKIKRNRDTGYVLLNSHINIATDVAKHGNMNCYNKKSAEKLDNIYAAILFIGRSIR